MTETPRSSFIPKQTTAAVPSRARRRRKYNIFGFVATAVLIGSLLLSVGVFFYKDIQSSALESEKEALRAQRTRFNEADIANVRDLSHQLSAAEHRLNSHLALSKVLDTLELTTKESVQFMGLTLEQRPSRDVSIVVRGATEEFTAVALQALQFGKDPLMKDSIFTNLTTQDKNAEQLLQSEDAPVAESEEENEEPRVSFSVEGNIAASHLAFEGVIPVIDIMDDDGEGGMIDDLAEVSEMDDVTTEDGSTDDSDLSDEEASLDEALVDLDQEFEELDELFEEGEL